MLSKIKKMVLVSGVAATMLGFAVTPALAGAQDTLVVGEWDTKPACDKGTKEAFNRNPGYTGWYCEYVPVWHKWKGVLSR